jgi:hypothetical protein
MHSQTNFLIAIVVIALFAMGATYLLTRAAGIREYSGSDTVKQAVQNGNFAPFDGASSTEHPSY